MSTKIPILLEWCRSRGVVIDPRLSLVQNVATGDITVYNKSEESIPNLQTRNSDLCILDIVNSKITVVTIPKTCILSIRNCSMAGALAETLGTLDILIPPYGHEAKLALALALYIEL